MHVVWTVGVVQNNELVILISTSLSIFFHISIWNLS
jgi:hypothetical protein